VAYFIILGLTEGIWVAHIPAVKDRLHLADGLLGASLLAGPAGLVLVMPLAGRLADRFGSARLIRLAGLYVAVLPLALWTAQTLATVIGSVLAFGITGGFVVVGLNAQGLRVERGYGRPLMASFYASYSLGGLAGALLGGLLAWWRAGLLSALDSIVAVCVAVAIIAGYRLLPEPATPRRAWARLGRDRAGRRTLPGAAPRRLIALGLLALCCVITEGTVATWSGVYLRDVLDTPGWFAAAGFAGFSLAMAAGRLAGDRLAVRFGPAGLVRGGGLLTVAGLASALDTHQAWIAVVGFAACGGGLSCTIPQLMSAAGRADPDHPGRAVARVGGVGYLGLVGGPVLIGGWASLAGLTIALYIPILLALCVTAFAFVLDRPVVSEPVVSEPVVSEPVLSGTEPGRSAGLRSR
jgi:MFS family permease